MAVRGRTSSRILFHMSSVGTTDHMSWGMSRRTVEGARTAVPDRNTKEGELLLSDGDTSCRVAACDHSSPDGWNTFEARTASVAC